MVRNLVALLAIVLILMATRFACLSAKFHIYTLEFGGLTSTLAEKILTNSVQALFCFFLAIPPGLLCTWGAGRGITQWLTRLTILLGCSGAIAVLLKAFDLVNYALRNPELDYPTADLLQSVHTTPIILIPILAIIATAAIVIGSRAPKENQD